MSFYSQDVITTTLFGGTKSYSFCPIDISLSLSAMQVKCSTTCPVVLL